MNGSTLSDYLAALRLLWPALVALPAALWAITHLIYRNHIDTLNSRIKLREDERDAAVKALSRNNENAASIERQVEVPLSPQTLANEAPPAVRDSGLGEALAYAFFRKWGRKFVDAVGSEGSDANAELERFMQMAADSELTVWGRAKEGGVFIKIEPEVFQSCQLDWFALLRGEAQIEPRVAYMPPKWRDLMVSKAEFEHHWPPNGPQGPRTISQVHPSHSIELRKLRELVDGVAEAIRQNYPWESRPEIEKAVKLLQESRHPIWLRDDVRGARDDLIRFWNGLRSKGLSEIDAYFSNSEAFKVLSKLDDVVARLKTGLCGGEVPSPQQAS